MFEYLMLYVTIMSGNITNMLKAISTPVTFFSVVAIIVFVILLIVCNADGSFQIEKDEKDYKAYCTFKKGLKYSLLALTLSIIMYCVSCLIPSPKQLAMIYFIPKIMHNENVQQIPNNIAVLANEGIKELIQVVKDETKERVQPQAEVTSQEEVK